MTQEWFESADFEKTANNDKKDNPSDSVLLEEDAETREEAPVVEENPQANPEDKETSEETVETEELAEKLEKIDESEDPVKEASQKSQSLTSKSLESPFLPDSVSTKTAVFAVFKEELADQWVWLLGALKEPTARFDTDKKHSYNAFALLTIFSALSFFCAIYHIKHDYYGHMAAINSHAVEQFPSLNLFSIFSILVATSLLWVDSWLYVLSIRTMTGHWKKPCKSIADSSPFHSCSRVLRVSLPSLIVYALRLFSASLALVWYFLPTSIPSQDQVKIAKLTPSIAFS